MATKPKSTQPNDEQPINAITVNVQPNGQITGSNLDASQIQHTLILSKVTLIESMIEHAQAEENLAEEEAKLLALETAVQAELAKRSLTKKTEEIKAKTTVTAAAVAQVSNALDRFRSKK
jgi:hypothetical protein